MTLPLRFKAVDTETGQVCGVAHLNQRRLWGDHNGGDEGVEFSAFFHQSGLDEDAIDLIGLYQSTGHHDANGQELFFGDVLIDPDDKLHVVAFEGGNLALKLLKGGHQLFGFPMHDLLIAVGNVHTPPDQLESAAQKVRAEHANQTK